MMILNDEQKQELRAELEEILEILFFAQENYKAFKYLRIREDDDDKAYVKKMNAYFGFAAITHWRTVIIELSKLFASRKNEHYNLHRFVGKLKTGGEYFGAEISEVKIREWEDIFVIQKDVIADLITLRDKAIAHKDKDGKTLKSELTLGKIWRLIETVQKLIREIYLTVFEVSYLVDDPINAPVENLRWIVEELAEQRKK